MKSQLIVFGLLILSSLFLNGQKPDKFFFDQNLDQLKIGQSDITIARKIYGKPDHVEISKSRMSYLYHITELSYDNIGLKLIFTGGKKKKTQKLAAIVIKENSPITINDRIKTSKSSFKEVIDLFGEPKYASDEDSRITYNTKEPRLRYDFYFMDNTLVKVWIGSY